jgi:thymidylate synthase (FAD)
VVALIQELITKGHDGPFEHAQFTFSVEGISRACSHQLVRHRLASYCQKSQRYVDSSAEEVVTPRSVAASARASEMLARWDDVAASCQGLYNDLVELGVPKEDARYILPQGVTTSLVVTMNARELRHFFSLRLCSRAQWEIRELAERMYEELGNAHVGLLFERVMRCKTCGVKGCK